jgi:pyruvate/2-oxoglutarate dehydrogenase complex dihydrolipoamide acyltransferase (E2) component
MPRIPITMPQLGESIAEATILTVEVAAGSLVKADQDVLEVETQKATMNVTTPYAGTVVEWICEVGQSYAVGALLGHLEISDEDAAAAGLYAPGSPHEAAPSHDAKDETLHFKVDEANRMSDNLRVEPTLTGLPVPVVGTGASYISPRLRARMAELGLNASDLAGIAGSGAGGRVTVEDFESYMAKLEEHTMTQASPMRIAVADSMRRSWSRPLATIGMKVNLEPLLAHRRAQDAPKPGPALYAIRALALALHEQSAVAGRLVGNRIVHPKAIDIGFAVEVEDGVLVPVLRAVDTTSLASLVGKYSDLVQRARNKKLPPDAMGAGTATVTNFGTFGIEWATPIPLPEQNVLLGMGAGIVVPVFNESTRQFEPVTQAEMTLSFDHRVADGGAAGRLLARVIHFLQNPEVL